MKKVKVTERKLLLNEIIRAAHNFNPCILLYHLSELQTSITHSPVDGDLYAVCYAHHVRSLNNI